MKSHSQWCQDPACFCVDTVPAKDERRVRVGDRVVDLCPDPNPTAAAGCVFRITSTACQSFLAYAEEIVDRGILKDYAARGKTWDFADAEKPQSLAESLVGVDSEREAARADNERAASEKSVQPAPAMTEREREAWEIHNAGLMAGYGFTPISWLAMEESQRREALAARDKAAEIFAEKARAGLQQAMDAAGAELFQARRVRDDCRASHDKAMAMLKEAQTERDLLQERHCLLQQEYGKKVFENERLTARNAELAKALREACGRSPGGDPAISDNERPIVCTCCKIHGKASAK